MSLNKHRTPSAILNSSLVVPNHTKRDSFTPMPSKQSDIVELSSRNPIGNRPQDLPRYKNSFPAENHVEPMTWSSPFEDSPPPETKTKAPLAKGKSTTGFHKASKDENVPVITSSYTNRHLGPWLSEEGYTRKPTSYEGRKSYTRLWKEGRDMRDALKNMSGNRSVNMDQEVVKVNSYLKQHQNKMVKKNAAAIFIQRWFRERLHKRQEKRFYGKQGAKIQMPRNRSQEIKRAKEVGNSKRSHKQLQQQQQNYEYEEQETDRNINNGGETSSENRVLEEMYKKMQANILSRIDKRSNQDSSSNRDAQRTLESYSSREQARGINAKQAQTRGQYMQTSPDRLDTWERSSRQEAYTFRDFERTVIVIQRAVREYLRRKRRANQSKVTKNVSQGQGDNMYKIIEQLANELKQANLKVAGLQRENERLKNDMDQTEEKMEKVVEARVVSEKAKFKEMLEEYTQFIDKLLQEKMGITQHYEMIVSTNKELKAQISKYETEDNRKELEDKIEELQNENKVLQEKCDKLSSEMRDLEEEKKDLCSVENVKKLEDENKKLRARAKDLETQFNQAIDRIAKYSQVGEINQILLQKLQAAGDHIQEIEEKLKLSEEQYKALEQKFKEGVNSPSKVKNDIKQEAINNVKNDKRMYIGDNSPEKPISPSKPQQTVKDEEEVIIGEPSLAQSITIPTKRSLAESDHQKAGEEPVDFSFEAKGSGVYDQEISHKGGSKTNLDHEDIQPIVKEVRSSRRQEEDGEYQEEENEGEEGAHPFELRKCSGDYVSGKFAQQEESSVVQETTLDEEQGMEINMLIQNISRKLELAKTKMEDRPITTIEETEEENILSYRDPAFHKALSSKELAGEQESGFKLENRAKSTVNLHHGSFTVEEQEQGKEDGQKKKSEAKGSGNVKKGIMDTLKKAELLFGRGENL